MSTIYTATVTGSRLKDLECEKCGQTCYYLLTRAASGSREDSLFTSEYDARKGAQEDALAALNWALDHDHDLVPCPTCRHVQAFLIDEERARRADPYLTGLGLAGLGFLAAAGFGVVSIVAALADPNRRGTDGFLLPAGCLIAAFGCGVGFLFAGLKWRAGRGFDPNTNPLDFPRGLTTNKPMTRQQFEETLRRQATEAIAVLGRPVPFGDPEALDRWTAAQGVVRLAAKELNDANLAGWAKIEPVFAHPPAAASQPPAGPNPFQFT